MGKTSAEVRREGRKKGKRGVKDRKKVEGMKAQVKEGEKEGRIESKGEGKKREESWGRRRKKRGRRQIVEIIGTAEKGWKKRGERVI